MKQSVMIKMFRIMIDIFYPANNHIFM